MLMDVQIDGLECNGTILRYLDPQDLRRLQGLAKIDLYDDRFNILTILKNCQLNDITSFHLGYDCKDQFLSVIGENCSKLQVLRVPRSNITDKGLCALHPCKELRIVDIVYCDQVSHVGINLLISVHEKLEELSYGATDDDVDYCSILNRMDKPCLTMKRSSIKSCVVSYANLCSIVEMFPNLTDLGLNCVPIRDFSVLKSLSNLNGIHLNVTDSHSSHDVYSVWESLQELFKLIGTNITRFRFKAHPKHCVMDRQGLQFLYEHCPNLESLICDYKSRLVVPPFPKLKLLQLFGNCAFIPVQVNQFGTMLNLEVLKLLVFYLDSTNARIMVLDDERFPKLKRYESQFSCDKDLVNRFARENNRDFIWKRFRLLESYFG